MEVLVPLTIDETVLVSVDADGSPMAEDTSPAWVSGTTYALKDLVHRTQTHRVYERAVAGGGTTAPENDAVNWFDFGPTNKWAMFDGVVSTQTVADSPIVIVLIAPFINAIGFAGLDGTLIHVSVKDEVGGTVVFDEGYPLEDDPPIDYYEWFFNPFKQATDLIVTGIPPYPEAEITITITNDIVDAKAKCGMLAIGDLRPLGKTLKGAEAKPVDYSYVSTDQYGNNIIKKRKSAKDMNVSAIIELQEANEIVDTVHGLLSVPCFWIASKHAVYRGLRCYGLGSAAITYDHPAHCNLNITVKGLI